MKENSCPYCNFKISYWDKIKPVFGINQQFVLCSSCHKKISDYWLKRGRGVGLALGGLAIGRIAAQSTNPTAWVLGAFAFLIIIFMYAATRIQLKQCDELTLEKIQAEYIAKETSINPVRVVLIVISAIFAFSLLIWVVGRG